VEAQWFALEAAFLEEGNFSISIAIAKNNIQF
jgi:hypothetical protein